LLLLWHFGRRIWWDKPRIVMGELNPEILVPQTVADDVVGIDQCDRSHGTVVRYRKSSVLLVQFTRDGRKFT
jgi:hypothetical protein